MFPFSACSVFSFEIYKSVKTKGVSFIGVCHICRLQTADCRPQIADCRPQIADCKLKDTKNLPNKGDTIKNITSCEREKVAWEQRLKNLRSAALNVNLKIVKLTLLL